MREDKEEAYTLNEAGSLDYYMRLDISSTEYSLFLQLEVIGKFYCYLRVIRSHGTCPRFYPTGREMLPAKQV